MINEKGKIIFNAGDSTYCIAESNFIRIRKAEIVKHNAVVEICGIVNTLVQIIHSHTIPPILSERFYYVCGCNFFFPYIHIGKSIRSICLKRNIRRSTFVKLQLSPIF